VSAVRSTNSASAVRSDTPGEVRGSIVPRLWTPPLRELTPETSYGFDLIEFAKIIGEPFDPWEEWLSIHAGELLPDGRPRFRTVLALVARQNGKTTWAKVLVKYWLFVEKVPFVLGTSTDRSYAKKAWNDILNECQTNQILAPELAKPRLTIGEEELVTIHGSAYSFAANNRRAGRSRTVHRWLCDEVREHHDMQTWEAASNAMNAVPDAQIVAVSNQGDDRSVLLDALRDPALHYIETGEGDARLGIFEWSAPPGADPADVNMLAQANPNLGHRVDVDALVSTARRAMVKGGVELAGFRTEVLCQRVALLDPAIDPEVWEAAFVEEFPDLAEHRDKVALCLDISLSGDHATLIAAAEIDGVTYVDVVAAWSGIGCTQAVRADLPDIVRRVRPRRLGWFPAGPAAELAADLAEKRRAGWPPRRVELSPLKSETAAVCMALPGLVRGGEVLHSGDPMLKAHVEAAQRLNRGDAWVFGRRGAGAVDGVYAVAGAVHLSRTLPPPLPPLSVA
jgi:hypothetical protein